MSITRQNLSIVIVTLRSEKVIFECLDSINLEIPVFIIENSSNFEFKNLLEKKYKNVKCILTEKNLGMGTGNNIGIKLVKTDYVLILNPDITLEANTLEELMISSKNNQDFSILSPISSNNKYPNYKPYEGDNLNEQDNFLFKVKSVDGYAMLFNKKRINEVLKKEPEIKNQKYFDENFFMYLENDDLCKRVIMNDGKILVASKAQINHLGGKAINEKYRDEVELSRNWHWIWSKFYFNKKHYGLLKALFQGLPQFFFSIFKIIFFTIINNKIRKKIYINRASGFLSAMLGKRSWYRPNLD
jgi:N-acetylglucosaminyl-diphospho-decaprenol L-rhamnosyltransferase